VNISTVSIARGGVLDLNGFVQTLAGLTLEGGVGSGANVTMGAGQINLDGNLQTTVSGGGPVGALISGNIYLSSNRTFTIADGSAVGDLTMNAVVLGPGGIIKDGAGTVTFNAANTLSGTTAINNGRAIVVGSLDNSNVIVSSGVGVGMLLGTGSVKSIVAAAGSYVSPGMPALTSGPDVQLLADSFFTVSIAGPAVNDKLVATGNVSLAGNLNVSLNYAPAVGATFTIIDGTGGTGTVTGTFAGVPEGTILGFGAYKLQIHYDTKSVTLTAVCGMPDATTPTVTAPAAATVTQSVCQ
jgi:autotransporter-associated beta strand protein